MSEPSANAYEPDDIYTVWLVEGHRKRQPRSVVLACLREAYCDTLQSVIEYAYEEAIPEHKLHSAWELTFGQELTKAN